MNNPIANILSGLLGGLIVLILGAVLISTDVIDTGDSTSVVQRQSPITEPSSDDPDGGRTVRDIDAEVKGVDISSDLAALKIDPSEVKDLEVLPLGDSSKVEVGDPVVALGN